MEFELDYDLIYPTSRSKTSLKLMNPTNTQFFNVAITQDLYLASGFFNPIQNADLENMKACATNLGYTFYSPKDQLVCPADAQQSFATYVLNENIRQIRSSAKVFANLRHKDLGTSFEVGLAAAYNKEVMFLQSNDELGELAVEAKGILSKLPELLKSKQCLPGYHFTYAIDTTGKDLANVITAGYAYGLGYSLIYKAYGLPEGAQFNLMLAQTGIAVCRSEAEYNYALEQLELNPMWTQPFVGPIE